MLVHSLVALAALHQCTCKTKARPATALQTDDVGPRSADAGELADLLFPKRGSLPLGQYPRQLLKESQLYLDHL